MGRYEFDSDAEYGKPRRVRTQKLPSEETESDEYEPDSDAEYLTQRHTWRGGANVRGFGQRNAIGSYYSSIAA